MPETGTDVFRPDRGPQRPAAGPFERWPLSTDLLIALLCLLATLAMWSRASSSLGWSPDSLSGVATYLGAFTAHLALLWRRTHALAVHLLVLAAIVLIQLGSPVDGLVGLTVSLYSLGRYEPNSRYSLLGAAAGAVLVVFDLESPALPETGDGVAGALAVLLWYIGRRLRFRGEYLRLLEERARQMEREQHAEAERAVAAERTRIAREMHDVIAHQVSLMTVQAGAARTVMVADPKAASSAIASVERAGRQALSEMRHLLDVLRPADQRAALGPQPGLDDLAALVEQVNNAGPRVNLSLRGERDALPSRLQLNVYRVVQEALTNVIKHAGAGAAVQVLIEARDAVLRVSVQDNGCGVQSAASGGHGIAGMRERAEMLGGKLTAGPGSSHGFEVLAEFPIEGVQGVTN